MPLHLGSESTMSVAGCKRKKYPLRERLANRVHLIAARIYDDWHTLEVTTPSGDVVTFCCYWQWTGSWHGTERCSCNEEDLR